MKSAVPGLRGVGKGRSEKNEGLRVGEQAALLSTISHSCRALDSPPIYLQNLSVSALASGGKKEREREGASCQSIQLLPKGAVFCSRAHPVPSPRQPPQHWRSAPSFRAGPGRGSLVRLQIRAALPDLLLCQIGFGSGRQPPMPVCCLGRRERGMYITIPCVQF